MSLERLLQICIAILCALGTLALGMGKRDAILPVLAIIVAVSSVWMTDVQGWLRLTPRRASQVALAALVFAVWESLYRFNNETWLFAWANLLTYLQFVLMYQQKSLRVYWQLLMLSLMQVAVAAALSFSLSFGVVLACYVLVGIVTLSLFYIEREIQQTRAVRAGALTLAPRSGAMNGAGRQPVVPSLGQPSIAPSSNSNDVLQSIRGVAFWGQLVIVAIGTVAVALPLFLVVPRLGGPAWQATRITTSYVTGVSETVTLGEIGRIIESTEEAMRVEFIDDINKERYRLQTEPMLRGSVLLNYSRGQWSRIKSHGDDPPVPLSASAGYYPEAVRQKITIEPMTTNVLYCVYPLIGGAPNIRLKYDPLNHQLIRAGERRDVPFEFEVISSGFEAGRQLPITPVEDNPTGMLDEQSFLRQQASKPPNEDQMPSLVALAQELVANIPEEDRVSRARAMEWHFCYSGEFSSTLVLNREDRELDPIEDFIRNTHRGHCEYFASALALMLRSVGIPSRVVVGFKGGDYNRIGGFYQVRQQHAHAWVEAYLERQHLPRGMVGPPAIWEQGGWLRLDPTPAAGQDDASSGFSLTLATMRQGVDYLRFVWSSYIMGMTARRQQAAIYEPIVAGVRDAARAALDKRFWQRLGKRLSKFLGGQRSGWFGGEWFNWRAGLSVSLLLLMIVFAVRGVRGIAARIAHWRGGGVAVHRRAAPTVDFYHRLETLFARYQLVRAETLTQREFAHAAAQALAPRVPIDQSRPLLREVIDAFYGVRFGHRPLDTQRREAVEHALDELEGLLSAARSDGAHPAAGADR